MQLYAQHFLETLFYKNTINTSVHKKKHDILLTYQNFCQKLNNIITFTLIITTEKTNSD